MMHFQIMHESLARFNESFASFLYGLNMNAFCVDFPEVGSSVIGVSELPILTHTQGPIAESFRRAKQQHDHQLGDCVPGMISPVAFPETNATTALAQGRPPDKGSADVDGETTFMCVQCCSVTPFKPQVADTLVQDHGHVFRREPPNIIPEYLPISNATAVKIAGSIGQGTNARQRRPPSVPRKHAWNTSKWPSAAEGPRFEGMKDPQHLPREL